VDTDIGLTGLALSGLLVVVAVAVSLIRRLGLERDLLTAAVRAIAQLALVGFALRLVVDDDDPLVWVWVWIAAMLLFASVTVRRRADADRGVMVLALFAFSCAAFATLGVLFGLRVFEPTGRALVPLAGMMVGNSMTATVLATRRITTEVKEQRELIEARVALGATIDEALLPHVRSALRTALVPQIETTKAVGIVFLPGAMTGLILAGVEPVEAVRVQTAVMYLVLGSVATTTFVMTFGLTRRMFSTARGARPRPRLRPWARPPDHLSLRLRD
jgi:putative ABC transport system permease protein